MNLKNFTRLSLISLLMIGCQRVVSVGQPSESPVVQQTQTSVAELPTNPSTKSVSARVGTFVSGEHPTKGSVRLVSENGKQFLELDQSFTTSEQGPDLHVILHRSDNVIGSTKPPAYPIKEQDYVILGRLQKFKGNQRYPIPGNINLDDYKSAAIWCRMFNATFGAAKLSR
jgi:hypothetical protein